MKNPHLAPDPHAGIKLFSDIKTLYYLCSLIIRQIEQVEPPSPINNKPISADQTSDDPLSDNIYMVMGSTSDECQEVFYVCAWSALTGLSYVGTPNSTAS